MKKYIGTKQIEAEPMTRGDAWGKHLLREKPSTENKSANIRAEKLIITDSSTKEDYKKVLSLNVGDVFKVEGDYETCLARIEEVRAETEGSPETFGVCPITPGTSLFTVYGPQHLIVTDKM